MNNTYQRDTTIRTSTLPGHFHRKVIFLSILLHVLFFLLWENASFFNIFADIRPIPVQNEPIVLDLQPVPENRPKEVIETPQDAQIPEPPPKADFLSDRNAKARNPEPAPSQPPVEEPYSEGELDTHDLPPSPEIAPDTPVAGEPKPKDFKNLLNTENIVREQFRKKFEEKASDPSVTERNSIRHRQLAERVKDMGGLSFNTYNWNFAPYMLRLKALIEQNIFPPHAFTKLGLINGVTLLRFKIYPNGELKDLEVLDYQGHRSLMETSTSAVRISAPFPNLPADFPEPYLEVTGKFLYLVRNQQ